MATAALGTKKILKFEFNGKSEFYYYPKKVHERARLDSLFTFILLVGVPVLRQRRTNVLPHMEP